MPTETPSSTLHCAAEEEVVFGIQWQRTAAGGVDKASCLNNTASRSCQSNGTWSKPNMSDCVSSEFKDVLDFLVNKTVGSLPEELNKTIYNIEDLAVEDMVLVVEALKAITLYFESNLSEEHRGRLTPSIQLTLHSADQVLSSTMQPLWRSIQASRDPLVTNLPAVLLEQLEKLSLLLATVSINTSHESYYIRENLGVVYGMVDISKVDSLSLPGLDGHNKLKVVFPGISVPDVKIPSEFISDRLSNHSITKVPYAYAMFRNIAQFTPCHQCGSPPLFISPMLSLKLGIDIPCPKNTSMVTMEFTIPTNVLTMLDEPRCTFYNLTSNQWSSYAMRTRRNRNSPVVTCHSFHLTSFIVTQGQRDYEVTRNFSLFVYIGSGVLLFVAVLGIFLMLCTGCDICRRIQNLIHLNFAISMGAVALALIFGVHPLQSLLRVYFDRDLAPATVCTISASIIHYFVLATFAWLLSEAILFVAMVTRVKSKCVGCGCFLFFAGWLFPAAPVVCVALLKQPYIGLNEDGQLVCWIGSELETEIAYWLPIGIFAILSFLLALGTLIGICMQRKTFLSKDETKARYYDTRVMSIGVLILAIAMVITWVLAELMIRFGHLAIAAFFLVVLPLQAFVLTIMFICRNTFCGGKCTVFGKTRAQGRYNLWEADQNVGPKSPSSKKAEASSGKANDQSSDLKRRPSNSSVTFCKRPIHIANSDAVSISADTLTGIEMEMVTYPPVVDCSVGISRNSSFGEHTTHVIENHVTTTGDDNDDDGSICSRDDRSGTETSI
jgi:hypothetical protein